MERCTRNSSLGNLKFQNQFFESFQGSDYQQKNLLIFNNKNICAEDFPNSNFLVILSSSKTVGLSAIYNIFVGTETTQDGTAFVRLDKTEGEVPGLGRTNSGRIFVKWTGGTFGLIHASMFKLN